MVGSPYRAEQGWANTGLKEQSAAWGADRRLVPLPCSAVRLDLLYKCIGPLGEFPPGPRDEDPQGGMGWVSCEAVRSPQ